MLNGVLYIFTIDSRKLGRKNERTPLIYHVHWIIDQN